MRVVFWFALLLGMQSGVEAKERAGINVYGDIFPPFVYQSPSGDLAGISIDIFKSMARAGGASVYKIELYPWKRTFDLLQNQPNSIGLAVRRTAEREDTFAWIGPYYRGTISLYGLSTLGEAQVANEQWKTLTIGVKRGASDTRWLVQHGVAPSVLDESDTDLQNLKKLLLGRVQLVPMLKEEIEYYASILELEHSQLKPWVNLDCEVELYFVTSIQSNPDFIKQWQSKYENVQPLNESGHRGIERDMECGN